MIVGDLILYKDERWFVTFYDKMVKTVRIVNQAGDVEEILDQLDIHHPELVKVIANPGKSWKVLAAPTKSNAGPFVKLTVPGPLMRKERVLQPWVDWIQSDPFREGGSVFIRPGLGLQAQDLVKLTYQSGSTISVKVPFSFGTVAKAKTPKAPIKRPQVSRFTHILDEDD